MISVRRDGEMDPAIAGGFLFGARKNKGDAATASAWYRCFRA